MELKTLEAIAAAEEGGDFLAILNPYGECLPVGNTGRSRLDERGRDAAAPAVPLPSSPPVSPPHGQQVAPGARAKAGSATKDALQAAVAAVGRYVRGGGNWFEVGGYPFFVALEPGGRFLEYGATYPPAFADLFHIESQSGTAAVYRVQPREWAPWQGARDPGAIFVPGRIHCGGDAAGGWCDRPFATYAVRGTTWKSPVVRLTAGGSAPDDLRAYAAANGITRRIEDKMPPAVLEKFKRSVLVYYGGNCNEKLRGLSLLPVPAQIHFAEYLQGGFDKQYPDHLPPAARFGTPAEFRRFFDEAHKMGHLMVPYTNPTWWCDEPKGPTFEKAGEEPLLKQLDGMPSREQYAANSGFTVCHWHPAVQEANRRTLRQFREEYPVDILFQDQCGVRGWRYDINPSSPRPYASTEGLLSMIDEDSRQVPLSTESGWDGVVNAESQLCGMTWSLVPTENPPAWRWSMKARYDPALWEVFPLAEYLAHDKLAMIHHDLGQFVTNRQVLAWTLGLGYSMSYRVHAPALRNDAIRHWLLWLDRIQKSVAARYVGHSLDAFAHVRTSPQDDRLLRAEYGPLRVAANLGSRPRQEAGRDLAAYGFLATGPGLVAANLSRGGGRDFGEEGVSFVTEQRGRAIDVWIYARPGDKVVFLPPNLPITPLKLLFDKGPEVQTTVSQGFHTLGIPQQTGTESRTRYLWHARAQAD